ELVQAGGVAVDPRGDAFLGVRLGGAGIGRRRRRWRRVRRRSARRPRSVPARLRLGTGGRLAAARGEGGRAHDQPEQGRGPANTHPWHTAPSSVAGSRRVRSPTCTFPWNVAIATVAPPKPVTPRSALRPAGRRRSEPTR